jgi:hypothetical protein
MERRSGTVIISILFCFFLSAALMSGCSGGGDDNGTGPTTIMVTVVPPSANVQVGTTQQFVANVTGTTDTAVTWSIDPGGSGTISGAGLYTAPAAMPSNPLSVIRATLVADPTFAGVAVVTLTAAPPVTSTETLVLEGARSGWVRKPDDSIFVTNPYVGDLDSNGHVRGFASFVFPSFPAGAVIDSATLDLSNYTIMEGDPFTDLGKFRVVAVHYGSLQAGDYDLAGYETIFNQNGPPGSSVDATSAVATALANGWNRFQVRLQFQTDTDNDSQADYLKFEMGVTGTTLTITYTAPP